MRRLPTRAFLLAALTTLAALPAPADRKLPDEAPGSVAAPVPPPDPREAMLSGAIVALLGRQHLLRKPIDDDLSRDAFATYLDRLDAGKMFLLAKDRESLGKYKEDIDDELRRGSLDLAHDGQRIFVARVQVVEKLVAELLAAPFNHDDDESIELDPKKVATATTEDELRDRWRRRLELEVLERVGQMEARLTAAQNKTSKAEPGKVRDSRAAAGAGRGARANREVERDPTEREDAEDRSLPLAQIPATFEAREAKARADLAKSYAARFTRLRHPGPFDAASELVNAVTSSLDPHTNYLPPADKANFDLQMSGSLQGIGARLRERDDYVEVVELVPGGPSWRQGLLSPGDLILSVAADGKEPVDIANMRIDEVVAMIRGPKGTVVHLRIQKPAGAQSTVSITRDVVVVEETYARAAILSHSGRPGYGYIHVPSFYGGRDAKDPNQRTSSGDVRRLLTEMKAEKVAGVVLDLRSNGGGLLGDAIAMTGSLIDRGPVVQVRSGEGEVEVLSDDRPGTDYDGPVVVLVDRFSASASEIVAGALQDYHRAVIVGTGPTHGKGTVQVLADLDRASAGKVELGVLKMTVQQFFRVTGASTQRQGVTPDILLPDPAGHIDTGERTLDHAIPWSQIAAAEHENWRAGWTTSTLAKRSAARVAKQPVLAKIAAFTQVLRARRDDTRVPLARASFTAHRKEVEAALEAVSPNLKAAPAHFVVKPVDDTPVAPAPAGGRADDRQLVWRDSLARDPWVEECVNILGDMSK